MPLSKHSRQVFFQYIQQKQQQCLSKIIISKKNISDNCIKLPPEKKVSEVNKTLSQQRANKPLPNEAGQHSTAAGTSPVGYGYTYISGKSWSEVPSAHIAAAHCAACTPFWYVKQSAYAAFTQLQRGRNTSNWLVRDYA